MLGFGVLALDGLHALAELGGQLLVAEALDAGCVVAERVPACLAPGVVLVVAQDEGESLGVLLAAVVSAQLIPVVE